METVNGLWIKGPLSALEWLTILSFQQHGFRFQLWTYEPSTIHAPSFTIVKNAADILPKEALFSYAHTNRYGHGKDSYAGFSDIFRYKLLYERGGIWTDMDITCLQPFEIPDDYFFRYHHKAGAVGNFMKCPSNSELMKWCYEEATKKIDKDNKDWMLPISILNEGIQHFKLSNYIHKISNNDSFPEVLRLLSSSATLPADWKLIHWMHEEWRRLNISKVICLPKTTLDILYKQYGIKQDTYEGYKLLKNKILLSRYVYLLRNIRSTLQWYFVRNK